MRKTLTAALAAATFVSGFAAAGAADARPRGHDRYYYDNGYYDGRRYRRHRDNDDAAIAAGVLGLALGAALASGSNSGRTRYYERRYYDDGYYGRGYYAPPAYYGRRYSRTCRTTSYWDPYYGGYVERRRCW